MAEQTVLGPPLEPARGGLLWLQQSVRVAAVSRFRARNWVVTGITVGVVVLCVLFVARGVIQRRQMQFTVEQALLAPPQTHFSNSAYLVLPSRNSQVQIFLIGSLASQQPATESGNGA